MLKIGDKVQIKKRLVIDKLYGGDTFIDDMSKFKGKKTTIKDVFSGNISLNIDKGLWNWTEEMLIKIKK